jgi:hypothetical protein
MEKMRIVRTPCERQHSHPFQVVARNSFSRLGCHNRVLLRYRPCTTCKILIMYEYVFGEGCLRQQSTAGKREINYARYPQSFQIISGRRCCWLGDGGPIIQGWTSQERAQPDWPGGQRFLQGTRQLANQGVSFPALATVRDWLLCPLVHSLWRRQAMLAARQVTGRHLHRAHGDLGARYEMLEMLSSQEEP